MKRTVALCLPALWVSGCSSPQTATVAPTPRTIVVVATPSPAPFVTATLAPTPDLRAPMTRADAEWGTRTAPIVAEASTAYRTWADAKHETDGQQQEAMANFKASMLQCHQKLLVAPQSPNFAKTHQLLFDGTSKCVDGADTVLLGHTLPYGDQRTKTITRGFDSIRIGMNLIEDGNNALGEAINKIKG